MMGRITDVKKTYQCKLHVITSVYLTMTSCSLRHARGFLCAIYSLLFVVMLFVNMQILGWESDPSPDQPNRPRYCNQLIIAKHFMNNQSPKQLFAQNGSRNTFAYELANDKVCASATPPDALIFVISKSARFASRHAIRRTWGDFSRITSMSKFAHLRLQLLFLLDVDEAQLLAVKLEQRLYHDIIQVRLPQHYILSTYRDMAALHWTETYCPTAQVTVKTDDDIFLNTFLLGNVLSEILRRTPVSREPMRCESVAERNSSAMIYGVRFRDSLAIRDSKELDSETLRYVITNDEYPCVYYPDYMSGFGYIVNRHARVQLLCAFARHRLAFPLSDVYVTGILAEYLGIQRRHVHLKINYETADNCVQFFDGDSAYACASSSHYEKKDSSAGNDGYVFAKFNALWSRVCANQALYIDRDRLR